MSDEGRMLFIAQNKAICLKILQHLPGISNDENTWIDFKNLCLAPVNCRKFECDLKYLYFLQSKRNELDKRRCQGQGLMLVI